MDIAKLHNNVIMRNSKSIFAKLEEYVEKIKICGEDRNSYSKTDHSATFMRIKTDYMGNDQLLPAYNVQVGIADEYIAVVDVNQYRSDMDCFIPLMNKFYTTYGFLSEVPSSRCWIWFLQQLHLLWAAWNGKIYEIYHVQKRDYRQEVS